MAGSFNPEIASNPRSVLDACEQAFAAAYAAHLESEEVGYVTVAGDAEVIWLQNPSKLYTLILGRPRLDTNTNPEIAFWLTRINSFRASSKRYEDLVALHKDPSQLYIKKGENDTPVPFGIEQSQEVVAFLPEAEVVPSRAEL